MFSALQKCFLCPGQQAAAAADSPSIAGLSCSSSQQGASSDARGEPALQSSVGQHAASNAQQADASSSNVPGQTAPRDSSQQAAEEVCTSEEGGANTEGRVEGRLESRSGEQAGGPAGPQEPALLSGLGQQAAVTEVGELLFGPIWLCYRLCYLGHPPDLQRSGCEFWCVYVFNGLTGHPDDASPCMDFNLSACITAPVDKWTCD